MRRILSMFLAGAMALGSAGVSFAPAAAATVRAAPAIATDVGSIEQVRWDRPRHGNWRPRHHHRHRHHHYRPHYGFSFGVPYPWPYAYYQPRPRCRDLVLGYNGRWHCRRW